MESSISNSFSPLSAVLSVAPMIDWTTTYFRMLMRLLAPNALLYTEMQSSGAVINNPKKALSFHPMEKPLALQVGGADPFHLMECAKRAEDAGFDEINLNLGCPSDRVQAGRFGACLMKEPQRVAECIHAMKGVVNIPVTAKTRIGIDHQDSYEFFSEFINYLTQAGCDKLIIHARKAWLKGLNPKQNRTVPLINYDYVYRLKQSIINCPVIINGDIHTLEAIHQHLKVVDGVMLGRLVCQKPYSLALIHQSLYPSVVTLTREEVLKTYLNLMRPFFKAGVPRSVLTKPILNLLHGMPGAKVWKKEISDPRYDFIFSK